MLECAIYGGRLKFYQTERVTRRKEITQQLKGEKTVCLINVKVALKGALNKSGELTISAAKYMTVKRLVYTLNPCHIVVKARQNFPPNIR
jgi:hypothetical protein